MLIPRSLRNPRRPWAAHEGTAVPDRPAVGVKAVNPGEGKATCWRLPAGASDPRNLGETHRQTSPLAGTGLPPFPYPNSTLEAEEPLGTAVWVPRPREGVSEAREKPN